MNAFLLLVIGLITLITAIVLFDIWKQDMIELDERRGTQQAGRFTFRMVCETVLFLAIVLTLAVVFIGGLIP